MGVMKEMFDNFDAAERENKFLKKALETAAKFASSSCERCPYDSRFCCNRADKNVECAKAVEIYFQHAGRF